MKLPRAGDAIIDADKITDYLFSPEHPVGRFKAAFLRTLGYARQNWEILERDPREFHALQDVDEVVETRYGKKYLILLT